jgi:hypothetical protein
MFVDDNWFKNTNRPNSKKKQLCNKKKKSSSSSNDDDDDSSSSSSNNNNNNNNKSFRKIFSSSISNVLMTDRRHFENMFSFKMRAIGQ